MAEPEERVTVVCDHSKQIVEAYTSWIRMTCLSCGRVVNSYQRTVDLESDEKGTDGE